MTTAHSTQSTPHPPKQPLYLSPDELEACFDIDKYDIDSASGESLVKLAFPATRLVTEIINLSQRYPYINSAGLVLTVDVLLSVFEPVDAPRLMETNKGDV